jgi:ABC-2 type transport system ATP-binding protein
METVIQVDHLTHRYGSRTAVEDLSFRVERGEVLGLLGPNGAGKTTTVRLLNGLFAPVSGRIQVLGLDPVVDGARVRQQTGVLTETPALYERLSARQNLDFFGTLSGMKPVEIKSRSAELLAFFELAERGNEKVGVYSKGMKQRLALARALLAHPQILFLDEPTSGLDPEAAQQVHDLIRTVQQKEGRTVLLATHRLEEAERLCDRVAILNQGKLIAFGSQSELNQRVAPGLWVEVQFLASPESILVEKARQMPGVLAVHPADSIWRVQVKDREIVADLASLLVTGGARLLSIQPEQISLEEIYFTLQNNHGNGAK